MNPVVEAALGSWSFQPWPTISILLAAVVYLRGWWRLRLILPRRFTKFRAASFFSGLFFLYCAVASPLDAFSNLILQVHMVQHLLLTMAVPPLLLMGIPFLPMLCGLPKAFVREAVGPLLIWKPVKTIAGVLTHPIVCLGLFMTMNVMWHLPSFYELALHSSAWHQMEHICFLGSAILFWWPIIQPWPSRPRWPRWTLLPYLLIADIQNTVLGGFLSFYERVLYPTYEMAPHLLDITALQDQAAAGAIMWVPGSIVFLIPCAFVAVQAIASRRGVRPSEFFAATSSAKPKGGAIPKDFSALLIRSPRKKPFDILKIPGMTFAARSSFVRRCAQFLLFLLAAAIVADGFLGPKIGPMNLAGVLPWTHWRGFSVIALLAVGNLFCMVCPFTFVRDLGRKILPANRNWPHFLRSKWLAVALLALYLWAYEVFSLWNSPWLTAWIIIGYFTAALVIDGFFKGASFCKYVCPIGQFNFIQSLVSPFEIKTRSHDVCASCRTHDCIRGNETQRGCELRLYQPRKSGNMDCTFCLDCVKACPHDNIGIIAGAPAHDLFEEQRRSSVGRYALRTDIACLALLLVFGAFANAGGMVLPVIAMEKRIEEAWGWAHFASASAFLFCVAIAIPALLTILCTWLSHKAAIKGSGKKSLFCDFAMALVPLGATMWAAHFFFHLVTGLDTPLPVLQRIMGDRFHFPTLPGKILAMLLSALPVIEILLLDFGLLLALYAMWRTAKRHADRHIIFVALPWAFLAIALYIAGVWIIFQPMEMRGTLMP